MVLVLGALSVLGACTSTEPAGAVDVEQAVRIATDAANASGATPAGAAGGDGRGAGGVVLGSMQQGVPYDAFAACTGGGRIGLDVAGSAYELDCDEQAHRVGEVRAERGELEVTLTQENDVASAWGVAFTQR